jgi:hypothetical protein
LLIHLSSYFADVVNVSMGDSVASVTKISTAGLTDCYGFLINGEYLRSSFCWLEHQPYYDDSDTSSPPQLLCEITQHFVENMKKDLPKVFSSSNIDLRQTSNLILLVAGCLQEFPDYVRNALALLQQPFHQELLGLCSMDPEVHHSMQHLQCRTIITAPIGYSLSEEADERAYAAGKS